MKPFRFLPAAILLLPSAALAQLPGATQDPPAVICNGIPGCCANPPCTDAGSLDTFASSFLPGITDVFLKATAALAVLSFVWAGFTLLFSNGDDGKMDKAKNVILYGLGGLALAMSANSLVSFIVNENFGRVGVLTIFGGAYPRLETFFFGPLGFFAAIVDIGLALFNASLVFVILYAGFLMVMGRGKQDQTHKGINMLKWAVVGAVAVNLARAVVRIFVSLPFWG